MNEIVYFLVPFVSIALMTIGFAWKDYTAMIIGGLLMFLYGLEILTVPLSFFDDLTNLLYGGCMFGFGAYVWIRSSIDVIKSYER